jgi:hypothetical protein
MQAIVPGMYSWGDFQAATDGSINSRFSVVFPAVIARWISLTPGDVQESATVPEKIL